jgi:hypothetical protein
VAADVENEKEEIDSDRMLAQRQVSSGQRSAEGRESREATGRRDLRVQSLLWASGRSGSA